ncbi:hypothetical protein TBLA_0A07880 [Henningerozyma blattae CBS 6284]|uniref:tRNA pseudouridine(55) synthase n=1 Tax=Henningerozyma blattae (strain ATCC 34711 / CBS 6284 / DSM 70876 / NBRC 10599 / NRRL Y-10934 / UCD 77-7) TaxID=1071380 RepID=I2GWS5_HENB6|nr:hypothetical protein TBLA_0A07880 [Tetrapisispora blattae CBS 6284]CCH58577.1 hypothetical protein TBLA_0A07880 [Tetrapisispora blattae CBS 6284]
MNGIFAIEKPSGITSNQFLQKLQNVLAHSQVFSKSIQAATSERAAEYERQTGKKPSKRKLRKVMKVKMGHGGTLDPLASGVLVIGIGSGTKKLSNYLNGCVKEYESKALFGIGTTSGDVEGDILSECSTKQLNWDDLNTAKEKFLGKLKQTPPIYAALKMNGKPLHEYARAGIPLPRKIEPRQVEIHELEIFKDSLTKDHGFKFLRPKDEETVETIKKLEMNANMLEDKLYYSTEYCAKNGIENEEVEYSPIPLTEEEKSLLNEQGENYQAPLLHMRAKVSSGTYIRSLISDIGKSQGSAAYMVQLIRTSQSEWSLTRQNVFKMEDFTERDEEVWRPVLEKVLAAGGDNTNIDESLKASQETFDKIKKTSQNIETMDQDKSQNGTDIDPSHTKEGQTESNPANKRTAEEANL